MKKTQALSPDLLNQMDAYWRHAHTKPHLLGLWGTTPGPNVIYVHFTSISTSSISPGRAMASRGSWQMPT